jgi:hypothetical protein
VKFLDAFDMLKTGKCDKIISDDACWYFEKQHINEDPYLKSITKAIEIVQAEDWQAIKFKCSEVVIAR